MISAKQESILVIGANGQIGSELVEELRRIYGSSNVIATDIKEPSTEVKNGGPFFQLDVLDFPKVHELIRKNNVSQVYLLAALLSATAEQKIKSAWKLNMEGLLGLLELAREEKFKLFWPSSIAVFGSNTPKKQTPQFTITEPSTVYGISKLAGERWCEYYFTHFGVDVRSIRYPGLIGYKTDPGGGTTDYAVTIFHEAIRNKKYTSFLSEKSTLPMMYMPDALRATISLMEADASTVSVRSSYNVAGMSFSPEELAAEICKHIPDFRINYSPDIRQKYADSWPQSIDDSVAFKDWGWKAEYDLCRMTEDMYNHIQHALVSH
ncbi:MAG: NAD-dependent epimerase/dehydratase family protein [Bacteroidetes bacterium]|nr:MAG: NAD-dependent epimerase/dehydratase family protein [Bacteroidota bacterium]